MTRNDLADRHIEWHGHDIWTELDEDGNYILSIYEQPSGEIIVSIGLTPSQGKYLFSIGEDN